MWIGAVAALASVGCFSPSIPDGYVCGENGACPPGQVCQNGSCTATPTSQVFDSGPGGADSAGRPDGAVCPTACSECSGGTCSLDCEGPGSCPNLVECPSGWDCHVRCGDGACGDGVDCSSAMDCQVDCQGSGSCRDVVICGSGRCDVTCSGPDSCDDGVECNAACACVVDCSGFGSCSADSECLGPRCVDGAGCDDQHPSCDSC